MAKLATSHCTWAHRHWASIVPLLDHWSIARVGHCDNLVESYDHMRLVLYSRVGHLSFFFMLALPLCSRLLFEFLSLTPFYHHCHHQFFLLSIIPSSLTLAL